MVKLSIIAPLVYIAVLVGTLAVFSSLYRKRKANKAASLEPWFGPHYSRDIYLTLLHQENPKVPDSILKAALVRRAAEDIRRIVTIRQAKGSLQQLLQRGSIGDDLWTRFTVAEAEIEEELKDVALEANGFSNEWAASIFQSAHEIVQATRIRERAAEVAEQAAVERAWWNGKRERASRELLGENSDEDGVLVESSGSKGAARPGTTAQRKGKSST
ncbi:Sec62/63 complex, subunit Sec66 [Tuber borchii]|uniref:Sec62/63 complex, subunit Sec66 n=1 Tax=Tuber borchii TaxID=42251 RepID=A0A2T7A089_TUBBO|nr:Sec62/63 complex, subunit Sec66 [Tuber borchii]